MVWPFEMDTVNNWAYLDNFLSNEECDKIIEIGNKRILKNASVGSGNIDPSIRNSNIAWLEPNDELNILYNKISDAINSLNFQHFKFDMYGLIEDLQFTKYEAPSGFYGKHIDKAFGQKIRKLSVTIQLSDPNDYEGGDLILYSGHFGDVMKKERGKLVIFPSYILHEVTPVTKGTRYSLVSWSTGNNFK
jgi:PKHD-type hydroxylase